MHDFLGRLLYCIAQAMDAKPEEFDVDRLVYLIEQEKKDLWVLKSIVITHKKNKEIYMKRIKIPY